MLVCFVHIEILVHSIQGVRITSQKISAVSNYLCTIDTAFSAHVELPTIM